MKLKQKVDSARKLKDEVADAMEKYAAAMESTSKELFEGAEDEAMQSVKKLAVSERVNVSSFALVEKLAELDSFRKTIM